MERTSYKEKRGHDTAVDIAHVARYAKLAHMNQTEHAREHFFKPAYGKIDEKKKTINKNSERGNRSNMRVETWCGYDIRFVEVNGEWWAILKDICDALGLKTFKASQRLDPSMMIRVRVNVCDIPSKDVRPKARKTQDMLAVNEIGIYEALFASRRLEARKFRRWSAGVLQKLRSHVGLEQYEVMRMTDTDIQDKIDRMLNDIFWNEEKGMLMERVNVPGGDVDLVPFEV